MSFLTMITVPVACYVLLCNFILTSSFQQKTDAQNDEFLHGQFPSDFLWGVGTSAYQVEGAWNVSGRSPSIWDTFSHKKTNIQDGSDGNKADDSYNHMDEDIQIIKRLKVQTYRFSISWSRILPNGTLDFVNQAGVDYYKKLITGLRNNNIEPMVTLYHWDLPQALHDSMGGWKNESIVDVFVDYARLMFTKLGDKVKYWITFNEPYDIAWLGYGSGDFAPGIKSPADVPYTVAANLIKSHVRTYHMYKKEFKSTQNGCISVK